MSPGTALTLAAALAAAAPPHGVSASSRPGWHFYGTAEGLSPEPWDVSADEAGNVYVAGGDAVYAKRRSEGRFRRYDAASAGLTRNCRTVPPESSLGFAAALNGTLHPDPPGPPVQCPVISVAGGAPGAAAIGYKGMGTDGDADAEWAQDSGGVDLVRFDGGALGLVRHVFVASPPHTVCATNDRPRFADSCPDASDYTWVNGHRKMRQVHRIAINHDPRSPMYGDVFMGGTHASIAVYLNNAGTRGWADRTVGQAGKWADAKDVWEHDHPAFYDALLKMFLTGTTRAIALHPASGVPWVSNGVRTAWLAGYGAELRRARGWSLQPKTAAQPLWIDVWPDAGPAWNPTDPLGATYDDVQSLSFCDDGTLWVGSGMHGLASLAPGSSEFAYTHLPDLDHDRDSVTSVACDPLDGSVWIGLGRGGILRLQHGQFTAPLPRSAPPFAAQPVASIQLDRWSARRIVYFAFAPSQDVRGETLRGGGVASYDGP